MISLVKYILSKKHQKCEFIVSEGVRRFMEENKPEIAIVAPTLDTVPSRFGNAIYDLIEDIASLSQHPVVVISRHFQDLPKSKISNQIIYFKYEKEHSWFERKIGYRGRKALFCASRTLDIFYLENVLEFLNKTPIRIVMTEDNTSFFSAINKRWAKRFIFIHHQHNSGILGMTKYCVRKYLNRYREVVFVSESNMLEAAQKHDLSKIKTSYIYNGINLDNYKLVDIDDLLPTCSKEIRLLYVGRIIPEKGIKELIEAIQLLTNLNIHLKIVGELKDNIGCEDGFVQNIERLAYSNSQKVELCGFVPQKKLHALYRWADFVAVPSLGREGLPKVIFESLVMGRPVIASKRGGIPEFITSLVNGVLIEDPVSKESIAKAIQLCFFHKEKIMANLSNQIEEYRARLSRERMSNEFDNVFQYWLRITTI